jgi:chromate transporter
MEALVVTGDDLQWQLAWQYLVEFAQVSLLAFGGGTSTLPEMHRRVVEQHAWATDGEFAEMFGLAQAAPGPNIMVACLIGWKVAQLPGALAGLVGVLGPSSLLAYWVTRLWDRKPNDRWRSLLLEALVPVTIGLTLSSGYLITQGAGRSAMAYVLIAASGISFFFWTRLHPLWWIAIGAALGYTGLL